MYTIPSSPMPPNSFAANDVDESTDENSMAGLAKRVSAYLARVVGALADFEDQLLARLGSSRVRSTSRSTSTCCCANSRATGAPRSSFRDPMLWVCSSRSLSPTRRSAPLAPTFTRGASSSLSLPRRSC